MAKQFASNTTARADAVGGSAPGEERLLLLRDGMQAFNQLLALIDAAETSLKLLFYTFVGDESGGAVRDRLIAARKRGVDVSLIVDDFGSLETPNAFFAPLGESGCRFCKFHPRLLQRYLLRNHQKILVADGARAIVGSFNIGDTYMQPRHDGWRDVGVRVEGDAAARLGRYFDVLETWMKAPRSRIRRLRRLLAAANEDHGTVRWVFGGPSRGHSNYVRQISHELAKATRADLIMAYFAPSPRVLVAVRRLARAGRFRLITGAKTDVKLARAAAWHTYRTLLRAGAEIYEYQPRPLHTKLIIVDDIVFIGSGNFDVRSLYVNLEVMLRVERQDFVRDVRALFDAELMDSQRIDLATLKAKQHWYKRISWRAAYFVVAIVDRFLSRKFVR